MTEVPERGAPMMKTGRGGDVDMREAPEANSNLHEDSVFSIFPFGRNQALTSRLDGAAPIRATQVVMARRWRDR